MVERFLSQTSFVSQEDYRKNLHIRVPENFNFGYDVVDAYAAEQPGKEALLWTDDQGAEIRFTFADIKRESDRTASYFQSLGIGKGDVVMLILKRRYEFWFSILALHKLGAVVIPATHLLTKKDVVYRCNTAGIKAIVAAHKFVPNSNARQLKVQQNRSIIIVVKGAFNMFFAAILERMQSLISCSGYSAEVHYLDEDADEVLVGEQLPRIC